MSSFGVTANKAVPPVTIEGHTGRNHHVVVTWLFVCCALIFAMVVLGGVTRLTQSGLSMVDWKPVMGVIPPLNNAEWNQAFEQYKQFPEYQYVNQEMTLPGFKRIYLVEYAHRVLGRLIGICFIVPFLFFLVRGMITRPLTGKLFAIFVLGGLQGLMGWYMVKSGLVDNPHVSQYRLTAHLGLAVLIYGLIFWTALNLIRPSSFRVTKEALFALILLVLVSLMIISGGFVAGTRAGFIMNTFPTMNGQWLPDNLFALSPAWRNLFENTVTVQFFHRCGALLVFIGVIKLAVYVMLNQVKRARQLAVWLLVAAVLLQLVLGISTLLLRVPVSLGAMHQAGALLLFAAAIFVLHAFLRVDLNSKNQKYETQEN